MTAVALIPTYQPDTRLVGLVHSLCERGFDGVVVDDGSGERYRRIFQRISNIATVIGYDKNRGKGYALKCGMTYIRDHYATDTVVVTVDADGQHDLNDVERCARAAEQTQETMVLGCRSFEDEDVPLRSRLGNKITRAVYGLTSGLSVSDTQTGLRSFSVTLIDFLLGVAGDRYEYEMNVLLECPARHVAIREVPIRTIYEDGNSSSHFRTIRDSARIYAGILKFAASSFASFLVDYACFALLSMLLGTWGTTGIFLANVCARLASGTTNFLLNRSLVFADTASGIRSSAVRYAFLASGILVGNTIAVLVLTSVVGLPALAAKLIAEIFFFVVSWVVQSRVVFRKEEQI